MSVYDQITKSYNRKSKLFALLIDTDDVDETRLDNFIQEINDSNVHLVFIGGSLLLKDNYDSLVAKIKQGVSVPVVLFPGNSIQVSDKADALLFLSLISGRNPEYLIGQQVLAAPRVKASGLEVISTGYILVDGGRQTSVTYMSNTIPIPRDKDGISVCTALAGEMLGNKIIYLDAGSGAIDAVPLSMIRAVKKNISVPLIVGGGLRSRKQIEQIYNAGADIVVVGNVIEENIDLLKELTSVAIS